MITDEKTQNRLYADTETTLFTLESKPEAVSRIMGIIQDTPEYVQLMHLLPSYAQDDPKADWWQGKEADYLLAELLDVLELYTPEGFILGPIIGRTYTFGYADAEYEKNLIYRIEIKIDRGHMYGEKEEYGKRKKLYEEMAEIFASDGYTAELEKRGKGCRMTKGDTKLYSHYDWITGYCEAVHLSGLIVLLLKGGRLFNFTKCSLLDSAFNFTKEEELQYYRQRHQTTVYYQIFDLFNRKPWAVTDTLMEVASEINIPTRNRPKDFDCNSPVYAYVLSAYRELLDKGYLEEYVRTFGKDETTCAKVTQKGISKHLFYGTQL